MAQKLITNKEQNLAYLIALFSSVLYICFAYFTTRESFGLVVIQYTLLFSFALYFWKKVDQFKFKHLVYLGILFRVLISFSNPNLSNDFYRFIWDGQLSLNGINPFLYIPNEFIESNNVNSGKTLIDGMGSLNASNYSCYPSVKQFVFVASAWFAKSNILYGVIVMRVFILLAELGVVYFGVKILQLFKLPKSKIFLFWLNPFVIIEMTGNVHFESTMLFFLFAAIYFFLQKRIYIAAILLAFAVMVKLIPLLFLPVFLFSLIRTDAKEIKTFSLNNSFQLLLKPILFMLFFVGTFGLLAAPFLSKELVANFMQSIHLYFVNFEFNASLYYILRAIGFKITGYNEIAIIGKILPIIVFVGVMLMSIIRKNDEPKTLLNTMFFSSVFYLLFATTVHPWYLILPLGLSLFTNFKFPVLWSFTVILSYFAYASIGFEENLGLVFLEYIVVIAFAFYEWKKRKISPF